MDWIVFSVVNILVCLSAVPVVAIGSVGIITNRGNPVRRIALYLYFLGNWAFLAAVTAGLSSIGYNDLFPFQWVTTVSLSILMISAILTLHLPAKPWTRWTVGTVLMCAVHSVLTWFVNRGSARIHSLQLAKRVQDAAETEAGREAADPDRRRNSDLAQRLAAWSETGI